MARGLIAMAPTVLTLNNCRDSAFWEAFWPSFWSGSASGVITGLITGLVVGIILLRYQKLHEERLAVRAYGRELSIKLDELRSALTLEDVLQIDSVQHAVPQPVAKTIAVLKELPITLWREALPGHLHLLSLAIELQKSHATFMTLAIRLDETVKQWVRAFNHQRGVSSGNDPGYLHMAVGMLFGRSIEGLLPWVASLGVTTPEACLEVWAPLSQDPEIQYLTPLLQHERARLNDLGRQLLGAIDA